MLDEAVEKVLENVVVKANQEMDRLLETVTKETHRALRTRLEETDDAVYRLAIISDSLPIIETLAKAVAKIKE